MEWNRMNDCQRLGKLLKTTQNRSKYFIWITNETEYLRMHLRLADIPIVCFNANESVWLWLLNKLIELPSKWDCKSIKTQFVKENYLTHSVSNATGVWWCVCGVDDDDNNWNDWNDDSNDGDDNKSSIQLVGHNLKKYLSTSPNPLTCT